MKKVIFICFILAAVSLAGCSKSVKDKIIGSWQLESVNDKPMPTDEKGILEFKSDGTLIQSLGTFKRDFQWKLSDDEMSLTFIMGKGKEEKNEILELDDATMKLKSRGDIAKLKKI